MCIYNQIIIIVIQKFASYFCINCWNNLIFYVFVILLGQKYEFACKWKIHIVKPQWLYDSIEARSCQDESKYSLTSEMSSVLSSSSLRQMKTSTPTKNITSGL